MAKHCLIKEIHNQLTDNFSYEQLCIICYDHSELLPVYKNLPSYNIGKEALIDRLIWYTDREGLLEVLYGLSLNSEENQPNLSSPNKTAAQPTRKMAPIKAAEPMPPSDLDEATRPSNPMTDASQPKRMTNNIQADKVSVIEAETVNIGGSIFT